MKLKFPIILSLIFLQSCASTSYDCRKMMNVDNLLLRSRSIIDRIKMSRQTSSELKDLKKSEDLLALENKLYEDLEKIIENNEKIKAVLNPNYRVHSMAFLECDEERNRRVGIYMKKDFKELINLIAAK